MKPAKRFPMLLWGDLVKGGRPILRRALAGFRAHECMYAWVYLTDHLAHRRLLEALPSMGADERRALLGSLDGALWQRIDRSRIDPHFQLSKSGFESVAWLAALAAQSGQVRPEFVELGSTFFTLRVKFDIIDRLARERFSDWPDLGPRWLGIDNSMFMHDATRVLHGADAVELIEDYRKAPVPEGYAAFVSRFVVSYAFPSGVDFVDWAAERFQAVFVEDAFSTTTHDVSVYNHGQHEVFFSIPRTLGRLEQAGYEVYVLGSYPDFPGAAAPCHVVTYLAARAGQVGAAVKARLAALGMHAPEQPTAVGDLLQSLNARVTQSRWRQIERAKRESPVWGPTPEAMPGSLIRAGKQLLRRVLRHSGWRNYRMGGPAALREIERALNEEKP